MSSTDAPSQTPTGESVKPVDEGGSEAKEESSKEKAGGWPFIEPQPIREDQVQNAVKFLAHPKVRSSPILHRRSFLERKGLSKEEIDEAFRRVPDTPPNESTNVSASREGQYNTSHGALQSQTTMPQSLTVLPSQQQPLLQQPVGAVPLSMVQAKRPLNWSHIFLAIGFFSAAGAGAGVLVMKVLLPKFKAWIRRIILEEEDAELQKQRKAHAVEEVSALAAAVAAANTAAAAATQVAEASRELIKSRNEDWQHLTSFAKALESNIQDLSSTVIGMKATLPNVDRPKELAGSPLDEPIVADVRKAQMNGTWRTLSPIEQVETREGIKRSSKPLNAGVISNGVFPDAETVQLSSAPSSIGPDRAPYSASYMEVLAMLERGEKPPGIQEVNDKPPNPNQPLSSSRLQPKPKPWETLQVQSSGNLLKTGTSNLNVGSLPVVENVAKSTSLIEIGNHGAPLVNSQGKYASFTESVTSIGNNIAEPWWRRKKVELETHNTSSWAPESSVRITEIDSTTNGDSNQLGSSSRPNSSGSRGGADVNSSTINAKVGRQGWVPPPVPSTMMPGAASAIRYSKVAAKDEAKILPFTEEKDSSALSLTGQDLPKEESDTEHEASSSGLSPQLVQVYEDGEGQGREPPKHVPVEMLSHKDALKEEVEGQEGL